MDFQLLLVVLFFLAALIYAGRRFYQQLRGKHKAGCAHCPAGESSPKNQK